MTNRGILAVCLFLVSIPSVSRAEDIWISQSGGTACGRSTQSAAWFNNPANWGGGAGEIDPGDTVYFCGTITSDLTVQASGTSGNDIIFDGLNATLNCRFSGGGDHSLGGQETPRHYLTMQNFTFASGRTGDYPAFRFYGASHLTVTNWTMLNANGDYVFDGTNSSYVTIDQANLDGINRYGLSFGKANHITLSRLHVVTAANAQSGQRDFLTSYGGSYITLEKSYIYNRQSGGTNGQDKNDIWETGCAVLPEWANNCQPSGTYAHHNVMRYNLLIMERSGSANYNFYLTGGGGPGGDAIYGNVFVVKGTNSLGQVIIYTYAGNNATIDIYNNTIAAIDVYPQTFLLIENPFGAITFNLKNNIIYNATSSGNAICLASTKYAACGTGTATINHSNNVWNGFASGTWNTQSCSSWASGHEKEVCNTNPLFSNYANDDFSLQESSIGMDAGIDLGSKYNQQIKPGSTWPNPTLITPSIMNIGAYGSDASMSIGTYVSDTRIPMAPTFVDLR